MSKAIDRENLLKQMFVDGVKSSNLKRYIGQKFRENPRLTFLQLRQIALENNEEFPVSKAHVKELVVEQEQRHVECSRNDQAPIWANQLLEITKELASGLNSLGQILQNNKKENDSS